LCNIEDDQPSSPALLLRNSDCPTEAIRRKQWRRRSVRTSQLRAWQWLRRGARWWSFVTDKWMSEVGDGPRALHSSVVLEVWLSWLHNE
ncbi:hypothetical protein TorRG33x02_229330, partial [Trema orientale]